MNDMNYAIAQHYQARDAAIKQLISILNSGYDIDERVLQKVCRECGLTGDGFESEKEYIIQALKREVK